MLDAVAVTIVTEKIFQKHLNRAPRNYADKAGYTQGCSELRCSSSVLALLRIIAIHGNV